LFILFAVKITTAQLTLTKAFNGPVVGDVSIDNYYDSTTAVSKVTGMNKIWNYSSVVTNTTPSANTTYTTVSSIPGASAAFPTANLASFSAPSNSTTNYSMIKSNPTNEEMLGTLSGTTITTYSNTQIQMTYPFTYGSNWTDNYGYSTGTGTNTVSEQGNFTIAGTGTGTLILPGNITLTNCLQVKLTGVFNFIQQSTPISVTLTAYEYYHSSQKFPVASFSYFTVDVFSQLSTDFSFSINNNVIASVKENTGNASFNLFPNPVNDKITISMDVNMPKNIEICISDVTGKLVRTEIINTGIKNHIDVADLQNGIYILTINSNGTNSRKKFIKN
ncbi:MAG: T9SS type A sorting domain-containing protein, partial [Bacteroidota bacterium]